MDIRPTDTVFNFIDFIEGPFKLQSKNFPSHMIGTDGDAGFIKEDGEEFYLIRPGLHGGHDGVSLLPCCNCQDHVMRHYESELFSEHPEDCRNPDCVADDASFNLVCYYRSYIT